MDTTFCFGFTIFGCWESDKSAFSFETIAKPFGFVTDEFEGFWAESDGAVIWDWYGVLGITD